MRNINKYRKILFILIIFIKSLIFSRRCVKICLDIIFFILKIWASEESMLRKWFSWINYGIGGTALFFLLSSAGVAATRPSEITITDPSLTKRALPPGAFAMPKHACDAISKTFDLKYSPAKILLPDLRNQLLYYGQNGRPDAQHEHIVMHFAFNGNGTPSALSIGEKNYLIYDNSKTPGQYQFSPNNAPTPLWIEATAQGTEATVTVKLRNENGDIVSEPAMNAQFKLTERENMRQSGRTWEIGKLRVDGSLLARQKARWVGPDKFLERHGGEEFKSFEGKHRIDFSDEDENTYSVYVGSNDTLIWKDNKWKEARAGEESRHYPLLVVKKIEERLMNFDLWDVGGKNKVTLNLLRINENAPAQSLPADFKFVGARKRSQYIFEISGERMFLSPKDWLLQTEEGWIKLNTVEQIDDYVNRKLTGVLFVFDGVEKEEDQQVLNGVMFNATRTDMQEVKIPVNKGRALTTSVADARKKETTRREENDDSDSDYSDDSDMLPPSAKIPVISPAQQERERAGARKDKQK